MFVCFFIYLRWFNLITIWMQKLYLQEWWTPFRGHYLQLFHFLQKKNRFGKIIYIYDCLNWVQPYQTSSTLFHCLTWFWLLNFCTQSYRRLITKNRKKIKKDRHYSYSLINLALFLGWNVCVLQTHYFPNKTAKVKIKM